jgi:hypothetical protein
MRDAASFIDPTDPSDEHVDRSILDLGTASYDPSKVGVGSTPWRDASSSRIFIPPASIPTGSARYLFRLAAITVPNYATCRVRGLRQAVQIGSVLQTREPPSAYPVDIDVISPFWSFVDGNVSWHLRFVPGAVLTQVPYIGRSTPLASTDYTGIQPTQLISLDGSPAAGGVPPGRPIGGLGTFRDIRWNWSVGEIATLDFEVQGGGVLGFYASVKQTNPQSRQQLGPLLPPGFNTSVLSREDQFVLANPNAIYRYISGAIVCEFGQLNRRPGINPKQGVTPNS